MHPNYNHHYVSLSLYITIIFRKTLPQRGFQAHVGFLYKRFTGQSARHDDDDKLKVTNEEHVCSRD